MGGPRDNSAVVLLARLSRRDVEVRIVEGLPWPVVEYRDLDWEWLMREAKVRDAQNRLGFIVTLGRRIAGKRGYDPAQARRRRCRLGISATGLRRPDLTSYCFSGGSNRTLTASGFR